MRSPSSSPEDHGVHTVSCTAGSTIEHPIIAAQLQIEVETQSGDDTLGYPDVVKVVKSNLQSLRKLKATSSIMRWLMQYTAIIDYIKIREQLRREGKAKRPFMRASNIVAARMGKGPAFARKVRWNTAYLFKHGRLPPMRTPKRSGGHSLLDNEAIKLEIRRFLASLGVGEITPLQLRKHVNNTIIPALLPQLPGLNLNEAISERTAQRWLNKLGYLRSSVKKGIYIDGHDRPDVVEYRKHFLDRMKELEKYVSFTLNSQI